jgi:hypothetical protein
MKRETGQRTTAVFAVPLGEKLSHFGSEMSGPLLGENTEALALQRFTPVS